MDDSYFGPAFVDVDEWRDTPVRHRYVHGGFEGTDTRFSFYFPPAEQWRGRLLQPLEGGNGGHENTAQGADGRRPAGSRSPLRAAATSWSRTRGTSATTCGSCSASRRSAPTAPARSRRATRGSSPPRCTARRRTTATCSAAAAGRRAACSASSSAPTSGRARSRTSWATPRRGRWASRCRRTRRACSARRWPTSSTRSSPVAPVIRSTA